MRDSWLIIITLFEPKLFVFNSHDLSFLLLHYSATVPKLAVVFVKAIVQVRNTKCGKPIIELT